MSLPNDSLYWGKIKFEAKESHLSLGQNAKLV